ncbi:MAG: Ig-like domain-containing protein [Gemmatimonadota bacterium]|nr:Ig-like domain-containing protein [Gemmatimonadota bacterium]
MAVLSWGPMNRSSRLLIFGSVILSLIALAHACGDEGTEPAPPTPEPSRPTSVTINPATARFAALNDTERLSAQVRDQHGQLMSVVTFAWTSSDPSVASADGEGLVTSVGSGSATITATAGSVSGSAAVTVAQELSAVVVSPDVEFMVEGDTRRFTAEAGDANGYPVAGTVFSWSSSDPGVVVIDDSGLVTAVGLGKAAITATAEGGRGAAEVSVVGGELAVLARFYRATNGGGWIEDEGWLTDRPIGEWHGVTTGEGGRVTGLELPASNLIGSLPPELAELTGLEVLDLRRNQLTGPIPPGLGNLPELRSLMLGVNGLTGEIPSQLGNLSNLEVLRLRRNRLSGPVASELGRLSSLTILGLDGNRLTGPVPSAFLALDRLGSFHFADNESACVAETADYLEWLGAIGVYAGPLCNESDRAVLESLHESLGGTNWTDSDGWLGDGLLRDWQGVGVDSLGRVTRLDLSQNGLEGRLPASLLERLTRLVSLRLDGNAALSGPLPTSLSALSVQELHYGDTGLCVPANRSFTDWLGAIASHEGTNVECPPLSDRDVLALLYSETSGAHWTEDTNWLSDLPPGEWFGVETDGDGRVTALELPRNRLRGQIPAELSSLSALRTLDLDRNSLWGPIPPTLGELAALTTLKLSFNRLSGPIPIALGKASSLETLELHYNGLSGPIPAALRNLERLQALTLGSNNLTGPIIRELGSLSALQELSLRYNHLAGPIPAELGNLSDLQVLSLSGNNLTGPIPTELTMLAGLRELYLSDNQLTGRIPAGLGNLSRLTSLRLDGNRLTGTIPTELGELSRLERLDLAENRLSGVVPAVLGTLPRLTGLYLGANALTGPIRPNWATCPTSNSWTSVRMH